MTTTLAEVRHKLDAWRPPAGFRRIFAESLDGPDRRLEIRLEDGPVQASTAIAWRDESDLAEALGTLDDRLDQLERVALARRTMLVAAERLERDTRRGPWDGPPVVADAAGEVYEAA